QELAQRQGPDGEREEGAPGLEVQAGDENRVQHQGQGVDRHDDGGRALDDEIARAIVGADDQAPAADAFLVGHYQTPNSFKPNTTVSPRPTPSTRAPERWEGSRALP